jgi:hypothetical protein
MLMFARLESGRNPTRKPDFQPGSTIAQPTLGFLVHCFWAGRNRWFLGFGRPRRPPQPFQKVGGEVPHLLAWFFGAAGAVQPQISTISGRPKNHVLKTHLQGKRCPGLLRPAEIATPTSRGDDRGARGGQADETQVVTGEAAFAVPGRLASLVMCRIPLGRPQRG